MNAFAESTLADALYYLDVAIALHGSAPDEAACVRMLLKVRGHLVAVQQLDALERELEKPVPVAEQSGPRLTVLK